MDNKINIPDIFNNNLDQELVSGLADKIIRSTELGREMAINDQYHMKKLAERAEAMTYEEALMTAKHFDTEVLIEALHYQVNFYKNFQRKFLDLTRDTIAELE